MSIIEWIFMRNTQSGDDVPNSPANSAAIPLLEDPAERIQVTDVQHIFDVSRGRKAFSP